MGNMGQASSFYNDRNEDIAPALVNVLLENNQEVPEWLQKYKDESGKAVFDDDTSEPGDDAGGAAVSGVVGGWGADAASSGATAGGWVAEPTASNGVGEKAKGGGWGSQQPVTAGASNGW